MIWFGIGLSCGKFDVVCLGSELLFFFLFEEIFGKVMLGKDVYLFFVCLERDVSDDIFNLWSLWLLMSILL